MSLFSPKPKVWVIFNDKIRKAKLEGIFKDSEDRTYYKVKIGTYDLLWTDQDLKRYRLKEITPGEVDLDKLKQ